MRAETVPACPHCDGTSRLRRRSGRHEHEKEWYCDGCNEPVDPVHRTPKDGHDPTYQNSPHAQSLRDASPDDIGRSA